MIDWSRIVGFDWDAGNARESVEKHGVGQTEAEQAFFSLPLIVAQDFGHSLAENRFHALGATYNGRRLHITFTLREGDTLIRVISARDMSVKERKIHAGKP